MDIKWCLGRKRAWEPEATALNEYSQVACEGSYLKEKVV